mmetsp:Transcript_6912/g.24944  ORF Transcript_6912/g.24944 Transcript_6912/m.24944 type:complete len:370 (+) Transcript_6912:3575-4684(+)
MLIPFSPISARSPPGRMSRSALRAHTSKTSSYLAVSKSALFEEDARMLSLREAFWIQGSWDVNAQVPPTVHPPFLQTISPSMALSRLLLPLPTWPTTITSSPLATVRFTFFSASAASADQEKSPFLMATASPSSLGALSPALVAGGSASRSFWSKKSWTLLNETLALIRFMICMGSISTGNLRMLKSDRAGKATEASRVYPIRAYVQNAARATRIGEAKKSIMFAMFRKAILRTILSSSSLSWVIFFMYALSHAYSFMAFIPVTNSVTYLTLASVFFRSSLLILPRRLATSEPAGIITIVTQSPTKAGTTWMILESMTMIAQSLRGAFQIWCRYCGMFHSLAASLDCRLFTLPEPTLAYPDELTVRAFL